MLIVVISCFCSKCEYYVYIVIVICIQVCDDEGGVYIRSGMCQKRGIRRQIMSSNKIQFSKVVSSHKHANDFNKEWMDEWMECEMDGMDGENLKQERRGWSNSIYRVGNRIR